MWICMGLVELRGWYSEPNWHVYMALRGTKTLWGFLQSWHIWYSLCPFFSVVLALKLVHPRCYGPRRCLCLCAWKRHWMQTVCSLPRTTHKMGQREYAATGIPSFNNELKHFYQAQFKIHVSNIDIISTSITPNRLYSKIYFMVS